MLRGILGFDHCPKNVADSWMANSGYSLERYYIVPGGKGIIVDSNSKLSCAAGTAGDRTLIQLNLSPFLGANGANTLTFGFRAKIETAGIVSNDNMLWTDYQRGQTGILMATAGGLFASMSVGTESFIEVVINLSSGAVEFYRNDVLIASNTNGASGHAAQYKAGNFAMTLLAANANTGAVVSYRDFYILDDVPGDGFTSRLGPRDVRPVTIDAVPVSTGWATTNGQTPLEVLNAPITTASPGLLESTPGAPALEVSLKSAFPANTKVEAIQLLVGAKGAAVNSRVGFALKDNKGQTAQRVATPGTVLKYGVPTGCWSRSPSGVEWTNATIDNTSLVITPDL